MVDMLTCKMDIFRVNILNIKYVYQATSMAITKTNNKIIVNGHDAKQENYQSWDKKTDICNPLNP